MMQTKRKSFIRAVIAFMIWLVMLVIIKQLEVIPTPDGAEHLTTAQNFLDMLPVLLFLVILVIGLMSAKQLFKRKCNE